MLLAKILLVLTVRSVFTVKKNYTMSSEDSDDSLEMFGPSDSDQAYVCNRYDK